MSGYSRFAKMKWIRVLNELIDAAEQADPGDPDTEWEWYARSQAQKVRWENRHYDFRNIGKAALACRDAVSVLRR